MSEPAKYLQIEPQHFWHGEAIIRGNKAALLSLAEALTEAANRDAAATEIYFASDGEGYHIEILRIEAPDNYPPPFYTAQIEHQDFGKDGEYCGKCGRKKEIGTTSTTITKGKS